MKRRTAVIFLVVLVVAVVAVLASGPIRKRIMLPSSKILIAPVPGDPKPMGAFPVNIALSPDQKYAAILEAGYGTAETELHQSIAVLDFASGEITRFADPRLGKDARQSFFLGIAWSSDGKHIYAPLSSISDPEGKKEGSTGNGIAVYAYDSGRITAERFIPIPPQPLAKGKTRGTIHKEVPAGMLAPYPAGIAVVKRDGGDQLLVANNLSDDVLLLDAASGKVIHRFDVSTGDYVPSAFPYGVVVDEQGTWAWVSAWNTPFLFKLHLESGRVVDKIDLRKETEKTEVSLHPTAMAWGANGILFIALSNTDEVAVFDTNWNVVLDHLSTRLSEQSATGTYPNALAVSSDGSRLYVANASSDAVAVFPTEPWTIRAAVGASATVFRRAQTHPTQSGVLSKGLNKPTAFLPTEWYPTALAVRGDELLIATGKGIGTGPNNIPRKKGEPSYHHSYTYIATLLKGSLARVNLKEVEPNLKQLTEEVLESNLMNGRTGTLPFKDGMNPIKHVIYIIKENRTYDQLFGDLGVGNGDPSLTMYGEETTPNHHALARQFGVLDNFYVSGEVSGNGHVWSNAAITSDYTEKTWQIGYRGNERTYDYEGMVGEDNPLQLGIPDVNEPGTGYLWTNLARNKKTFRHYGEYVATRWCDQNSDWQSPMQGTPLPKPVKCKQQSIKPGESLPKHLGGAPNPYPWEIPILGENVPTKRELVGHFHPLYADFRMEYPDQLRADVFLSEFNQWVATRTKSKRDTMPQFITLRLPNDHTSGTKEGAATPSAALADNDLALGRIVDAVSSSPYWEDTAIFVLEDDAQDGADHVDAHRSPALVISKYSPRQFATKSQSEESPEFGSPRLDVFVDSHFYTTVNMIHTMEVVLGLPPMNNNDAQAAIMAPLFSGPGTQPPFKADYRNRDNKLIYEVNKKDAPGAKESADLDFSHADQAETAKLNVILWRERMGSRPMPSPKFTVIPEKAGRDDDD